MILRRVGDYADSYDATTHKITRRIGVVVFDGTSRVQKNTSVPTNYLYYYRITGQPAIETNADVLSTHLIHRDYPPSETIGVNISVYDNDVIYLNFGQDIMNAQEAGNTAQGLKQYLASQYAAEAPVTVYYPLATPVEEDWPDTTYNSNIYIPQNQ